MRATVMASIQKEKQWVENYGYQHEVTKGGGWGKRGNRKKKGTERKGNKERKGNRKRKNKKEKETERNEVTKKEGYEQESGRKVSKYEIKERRREKGINAAHYITCYIISYQYEHKMLIKKSFLTVAD